MTVTLTLKRASASRPSGQWSEEDYDLLADGISLMTRKNRIMIYGPKDDGTYVVEFMTAEGDVLAISIPRTEAHVIRHFQGAIRVTNGESRHALRL
jgi:hypothetical protein